MSHRPNISIARLQCTAIAAVHVTRHSSLYGSKPAVALNLINPILPRQTVCDQHQLLCPSQETISGLHGWIIISILECHQSHYWDHYN